MIPYQKKIKKQIFDNLITKLNKDINIISLYNYFLDINNLNRITSEFVQYEDIPLLLYIKFELFGYPTDTNIKYITIDEGQDYNYMQYMIMRNIFKNAYFSILGDINQTLNYYIDYSSLKDIELVIKDSTYIELNKTYRSSKEIMEYTNKIFNISNYEVIRKDNTTPIIFRDIKYDINKDIAMLKKKYNSIAIIVKNEDSLKINDLKVATSEDKEISKITIIPVYLAKGLEFDAVIVYGIDNKDILNKKNFYVACTRALHQLIIYN
ncbi:MAG: ATP-binding domain-containing protein [Tenericutes bacterium]|nr:ATP-binding domain-containing protein [Mycoplasmatota bacterium]